VRLADRPDAMVFAAGLGTRLRPLTDRVPKALVEVGGEPVLGRILRKLAAAGAGRIVVNVHPFAERVETYLKVTSASLREEAPAPGPGPLLLVSREPERPLETGGGLLQAAPLFNADRPILLHNVDVLSDLDLAGLLSGHRASRTLATLAVQDRPSSRKLLFDEEGLLGREGEPLREARGPSVARAFAGVHVIEPEVLVLLGEVAGELAGAAGGRSGGGAPGAMAPAFSIVEAYLRLAAAGHRIAAHDVTASAWFDVGTPERLEEARRAAREGRI
jgi:NDP-sugar pyrophosphorylase family protein